MYNFSILKQLSKIKNNLKIVVNQDFEFTDGEKNGSMRGWRKKGKYLNNVDHFFIKKSYLCKTFRIYKMMPDRIDTRLLSSFFLMLNAQYSILKTLNY